MSATLRAVAAWGDWHPQVPVGMVAVRAKIDGTRGSHEAPCSDWLVPAAEYRAGNCHEFDGFHVNASEHQPLPGFDPWAWLKVGEAAA